MKKTLVAFAMAISTVSAFATDTSSIPSRRDAIAPIASVVSEPKMWIGVNAGGTVTDGINRNAPWSIGVVGGYNIVKLGPVGLGVEGTYDYKKGDTQTVFGNLLTSFSVGSFKPYVLAGVGYRWDNSQIFAINESVWNIGAGVKYSVVRNIELDVRYRHMENWDRKRPDDRATLGVNYKF